MANATDQRATQAAERPQLRADKQGYHYGQLTQDGFDALAGMDPLTRYMLASWADRYQEAPLSPAQADVLHRGRPTAQTSRKVLEAATLNLDRDLAALDHFGLVDALQEDDRERCLHPDAVLGAGRTYPVNATDAAKIAKTTYKQIRDWHRTGLLPTHEIEGRAQFFSAACLLACLLRPLEKWQVTAVRTVLRGPSDDPWRRLLGWADVQAATPTTDPAPRRVLGTPFVYDFAESLERAPVRRITPVDGEPVQRHGRVQDESSVRHAT